MTSDQLELEYEQAPSLEEKKNVLGKIAEVCIKKFLDETEERTKIEELFENLREDFRLLVAEHNIEENQRCEEEIEKGNLEVYRCINEVDDCKFGETYYVKIDDVASDYKSKGFHKMSEEMSEYINKIEPIVTIFCDKGIGTLKYRKIFSKSVVEFEQYFLKD